MMIWGRLIGIVLGYVLFKHLGAILGFWAGNWFDRGLRLHLTRIPKARAVAIQQAFFRATFLVMGQLCKADGRVNEKEIRAAQKIMTRLSLNAELRQEAVSLFQEGKQPEFEQEDALIDFLRECQRYPELLRLFIELQLEVALSDGDLQDQERTFLIALCQSLGLSADEFDRLRTRYRASQAFHEWFSQPRKNSRRPSGTLEQAYGVLGIQSDSSESEIKQAYRRLMNQHHPDKLAARGLPEGMIQAAKEKTQEIRAAYDVVRQARHFR